MSALSKLERECAELLGLRARLEEITVRSAARRMKKSPEFVRANIPVIVHGPKSHHVRAVDVEAYQEKRTVYPARSAIAPYQTSNIEHSARRAA